MREVSKHSGVDPLDIGVTMGKRVDQYGEYIHPHDEVTQEPENQAPEGSDLVNTPDMVNSPPHYNKGGIECCDAIQAMLTPEEFRGFLKGQVVKYHWREKHKGGTEDIKKGEWYLKRLLQFDEELAKIVEQENKEDAPYRT